MTTHAFQNHPREFLTDQKKAKLFLDREGRCHRCTTKIRCKRWYVEHLIALSCGGTNAWDNLVLTCEGCFHPKNADDAKKAAKIRAVAVSHCIPPSQRQRKGPPMPGSRRSRFKKHLDGRTTLRDRGE